MKVAALVVAIMAEKGDSEAGVTDGLDGDHGAVCMS